MNPKTPRVFKNWYTRKGQRINARGWCVRIQYQGLRRTMALKSATRQAATQEAAALFRDVQASGWSVVSPVPRSGALEALAVSDHKNRPLQGKSAVNYWKQCLVFRKYKGGVPYANYPVLSARLEHDGRAFFFPLGTDQPDAAALKAREIYGLLLNQGWKRVVSQYPHEFTVAVVWAQSPFCCTYTTMYTMIEDPPDMRASQEAQKGKKKIAVIEPNLAVRRALCAGVNQHTDFACAQDYENMKIALDQLDPENTDMVLLNRDLPEVLNSQAMSRINLRVPGIPIWTYGIYEDSDPIFVSVSGVQAGYIMRRRQHNAWLAPIFGAAQYQQFTARDAHKKIRDYFQSFFADSPEMEPKEETAQFSLREQEIVNFLRKGFIDKEIAASAGISIWTVRKHLHHIYRKLNVTTRTEAVIRLISR